MYPLLFGGFSAEDKMVFFTLSSYSLYFSTFCQFQEGGGNSCFNCEVGCMDGSADKGKTAKGGALTVHGCPVFLLSPFVF